MLSVPSSGSLDERYGRSDLVRSSATLEHEIKIMRIAVEILPRAFLSASTRSGSLLIQVKMVFASKLREHWDHGRFKDFSDDLAESMRWRLCHC
jgi:hypothetical protein